MTDHPQDICAQLRELLPAYAVGATDADETALVERLLPLCPDAAAELNDYRDLSAALLLAPEPVAPPPTLETRIFAALHTTPTPAAQPASAPVRLAAPTRPSAPTPVVAPVPRLTLAQRWGALAAAAAIVALVTSNLYWIAQVGELRRREADVLALAAEAQGRLLAVDSAFSRRLELTAAADGAPLATVLWQPDTAVALLITDALPDLPPEQTYQLWLIGGDAGDAALSAGVFMPQDGAAALVIDAPAALDQFDAVGVSVEPAGGSPAPTRDPIAVGQV